MKKQIRFKDKILIFDSCIECPIMIGWCKSEGASPMLCRGEDPNNCPLEDAE